jgi:hypothetical protein
MHFGEKRCMILVKEASMLLDKLWVRIRGEFLALKEDLSGEGDVRQRAEQFLDKLERRLGEACHGEAPAQNIDARLAAVSRKLDEASPGEALRTTRDDAPTLEELHEACEELRRLRSQPPGDAPDDSAPSPNPRRLG